MNDSKNTQSEATTPKDPKTSSNVTDKDLDKVSGGHASDVNAD